MGGEEGPGGGCQPSWPGRAGSTAVGEEAAPCAGLAAGWILAGLFLRISLCVRLKRSTGMMRDSQKALSPLLPLLRREWEVKEVEASLSWLVKMPRTQTEVFLLVGGQLSGAGSVGSAGALDDVEGEVSAGSCSAGAGLAAAGAFSLGALGGLAGAGWTLALGARVVSSCRSLDSLARKPNWPGEGILSLRARRALLQQTTLLVPLLCGVTSPTRGWL